MYQPWYQGWNEDCSDRRKESCYFWILESAEGKNPFHLDSKAPTTEYEDFIMGEVRYNALSRQNPERAKALFAEAKANAEAKYNRLKEMSDK